MIWDNRFQLLWFNEVLERNCVRGIYTLLLLFLRQGNFKSNFLIKSLLNSSSSCRPWNILLADLAPPVSFIFLRQDLAMLPKLSLDSWPQLIFLVSASWVQERGIYYLLHPREAPLRLLVWHATLKHKATWYSDQPDVSHIAEPCLSLFLTSSVYMLALTHIGCSWSYEGRRPFFAPVLCSAGRISHHYFSCHGCFISVWSLLKCHWTERSS